MISPKRKNEIIHQCDDMPENCYLAKRFDKSWGLALKTRQQMQFLPKVRFCPYCGKKMR